MLYSSLINPIKSKKRLQLKLIDILKEMNINNKYIELQIDSYEDDLECNLPNLIVM